MLEFVVIFFMFLFCPHAFLLHEVILIIHMASVAIHLLKWVIYIYLKKFFFMISLHLNISMAQMGWQVGHLISHDNGTFDLHNRS